MIICYKHPHSTIEATSFFGNSILSNYVQQLFLIQFIFHEKKNSSNSCAIFYGPGVFFRCPLFRDRTSLNYCKTCINQLAICLRLTTKKVRLAKFLLIIPDQNSGPFFGYSFLIGWYYLVGKQSNQFWWMRFSVIDKRVSTVAKNSFSTRPKIILLWARTLIYGTFLTREAFLTIYNLNHFG